MPDDKVCLNCKVLEQNTRNVPLFAKREGEKSLLPTIIRLDKYNPKGVLQEEFPTLTDLSTKVLMESNKRNTWVFYWAATRSKDPSHIMSERDAYGSNTNHGILKSDDNGDTEFVLNCPQPYRAGNITYPRHVHYTFLTDDNIWNENINSMVVLCHIDYEQMNKISQTKSHMIINALPEEEYEKNHIPNSINLYYKELSEMNKIERKHFLKRYVKKNIDKYSKLEALVNSKKLKLKEIPIVTYCYNKKCNASFKLTEYLIEADFVNVIEYSGGIEEWLKKEKGESEEEDVKEKDDIKEKQEDVKEGKEVEKEDNNDDDDMRKVEYEGQEYYIHEDTNDVSSAEDYELVGKWDPKEKRILWLSQVKKERAKDNKGNVDDNPKEKGDDKINNKNAVNPKEKEQDNDGIIGLDDKYKQKLYVNKLDNPKKDLEENHETEDKPDIDKDDKYIEDTTTSEEETFTTDEETDEEIIEERDIKGGAKTLIREIEENNETIKTNKKIKTESVNQEYKKWFTFF